ncbi:hypothetical protein LSH36_389g01001 [Paralvinella palmiformis]|uniref:TRAF3-interacting protein 1 n=1 Tax=Paralvinella palmiformis TaxID=53620 RepID=A0AAD9JCX5_9ANNE|nr:hypothetical protein LSH36_389g01001 [Paralvinella palmiformis]
MDPKIMKKTQDSLEKYIKKPPLTEKLLSKPPFRFLHDIMTSVIKGTGFMKGLFTADELVSDNVKERERKVAFLQKVIDMVSLVLGKTISAKPGKIVAGQEAEKTNELLQALGEAIGKKVNNDEYVKRVLKSSDKPASASKRESDGRKDEDAEPKSKSREDREKSRDRSHDKSKDRHKESSRDKEKEKVRDGHRDRSHDKEREKSRNKEREKSHDKEREKSRDKEREKSRDKEREKSRDKEREKSRDKDKERRHDKERSRDHHDRDKSRDKGRDHAGEGRHKDRERRKRQEENPEEDFSAANGAVEQQPQEPEPISVNKEEQIRQIEREKSSRRREAIKEDEDVPQQVASSQKMLRPSSARPAPPKVKKNEGQDEAVFLGSSNVPNLITDKDNSDDDEDEGFIAKDDDESEPLMSAPPNNQDDDADGEHGGLVKKMLEKKKELEGGSQQPGHKIEIERSQVNDVSRRKERELIQKEIDKLRTSIQTLTRSVNPLGKILDFFQEDLDSMHKEMIMWQTENQENTVALQREQSITESSVEPLKAQLKELEAATSDQLDLIAAVKHNILKNDDKIEKMLSTVTKS